MVKQLFLVSHSRAISLLFSPRPNKKYLQKNVFTYSAVLPSQGTLLYCRPEDNSPFCSSICSSLHYSNILKNNNTSVVL